MKTHWTKTTAEEWGEDEPAPLSDADRAAIEREIADLESFHALAVSVTHNAKGVAVLKALEIAFAKATEIGSRSSSNANQRNGSGQPRASLDWQISDAFGGEPAARNRSSCSIASPGTVRFVNGAHCPRAMR